MRKETLESVNHIASDVDGASWVSQCTTCTTEYGNPIYNLEIESQE